MRNLRKVLHIPLRGQRGITLLETLVAVAITGVIGPVVVLVIFQMQSYTSRNNAHLTVAADQGTAFRWLARDIRTANTTDLADEAAAVGNLRLDWTDRYEGATTTHFAIYSLDGTKLKRTYDSNTHTVANHVTSVEFSRVDKLLTVTLTSTSPLDGPNLTDVTTKFAHYFYLYAVP